MPCTCTNTHRGPQEAAFAPAAASPARAPPSWAWPLPQVLVREGKVRLILWEEVPHYMMVGQVNVRHPYGSQVGRLRGRLQILGAACLLCALVCVCVCMSWRLMHTGCGLGRPSSLVHTCLRTRRPRTQGWQARAKCMWRPRQPGAPPLLPTHAPIHHLPPQAGTPHRNPAPLPTRGAWPCAPCLTPRMPPLPCPPCLPTVFPLDSPSSTTTRC